MATRNHTTYRNVDCKYVLSYEQFFVGVYNAGIRMRVKETHRLFHQSQYMVGKLRRS